jgi:hypothetical protein
MVFCEEEMLMLFYLSGRPFLKREGTTWKYAPVLLKEQQILVLSLTTRHLFLFEWVDDALPLPMIETTLTHNEANLFHAIWDAYPGVCERETLTTMAMSREIVWRVVSNLRKKLRAFGLDIAVCEHGYRSLRAWLYPCRVRRKGRWEAVRAFSVACTRLPMLRDDR